MVSIDFFTVPTIRFQVLYVFLVLAHDRVHRRIFLHQTRADPEMLELRGWGMTSATGRTLVRDNNPYPLRQIGVCEMHSAPAFAVLESQAGPKSRNSSSSARTAASFVRLFMKERATLR